MTKKIQSLSSILFILGSFCGPESIKNHIRLLRFFLKDPFNEFWFIWETEGFYKNATGSHFGALGATSANVKIMFLCRQESDFTENRES